ncbi:MAG: PilZ domain-containing protein [Novosphingobium sp.]
MCRKLADSAWHGGWQTTDAANSCEDWSEVVYFEGKDGTLHVERRIAARANVDVPAMLQTPGGTRSARLADLSETGARVLVGDPPKAGIVALIQIGEREIFCRIVWAGDDSCGIAFEKALSSELVAVITGKAPARRMPSTIQTDRPPARKTFGVRGLAQPLRAMAKP